MDIDSINGGTVDSKGFLNPVVGTLRAKKIICDEIEGGGGVPTVANLGWNSLFPPQAPELVLSGQGLLLNTGVSPSASVPGAELVPGSTWELYAAGVITPVDSADGVLSLGIIFSNTVPPSGLLTDAACVVSYDNNLNTPAQYEYHGTFRVLSYDYDNFAITVSTVGKLVTRRNDGDVKTLVDTFERTTWAPGAGDGRVSVILCAGAFGSVFGVTRRLAYLRRIS
jgi:hypothetical protein